MNPALIQRGYADGRFGQIHYRIAKPDIDTGKRPLLCFHMSPYSSIIYERFLGEVGKDRVGIAMDTPGFGNSDPPPKQPAIEDYAGVATDLLDMMGIVSADVMGYHTGSKVAVQVAIDNPNRIHRVVMVSAPIYTEEDLIEVKRLYGQEPLTADGSHLQSWWQSAVRWSMAGRSLEDIGQVFWARVLNPAISWWGHAAAFAYDSKAAIPRVMQPIKVLNPEDDVWERTPRAKDLFSNPISHIHNLPGWSHGFLDLKTQETVALITEFLDAD
ncbi:MAG: alpha/beta fold hydrolase [Rhodospirillaceae bacterium]